MEFAQKLGKNWILTQNLEKNEICKFNDSRFPFQDVIYKKKPSFTSMSYLHY